MLKPFEELVKIDIEKYCEKKTGKNDKGEVITIPYLNWAKCKMLLHENGAKVVYFEPIYNDKDGTGLFATSQEFKDKYEKTNRCYEVRVKIVVDDLIFEQSAPLLNGTAVVNDETMNQLRVHNAQARAFVKGVAVRTGLGFDLWVKGGDEGVVVDDDLAIHDLLKIKKRIEEKITTFMKKNSKVDEKAICSMLGIKSIKSFLEYIDNIDKIEKTLNTLK